MSIWFQITIFSLTGLLIYVGVFYAVPRLNKAGVPLITAFFGALWLPVVLLLPLSLYFFVILEGGTLTFSTVAERFRLSPIARGDWWWIVAAVVVTAVADQLFEPLGKFCCGYCYCGEFWPRKKTIMKSSSWKINCP